MRKKIVFLELGVGYNTPGIIKYNFWQYAANWQNAFYICINQGQAYLPEDIEDKGDDQFEISDGRSVEEVYDALLAHDLQPVMSDYIYV